MAGCSESLDGAESAETSSIAKPSTSGTPSDLESRLTAKEERIEELERELEERNTTIGTLQEDLEARNATLNDLKTENQELKDEILSIEQELQARNQTLTSLESRLDEAKVKIDRLDKQIEKFDLSGWEEGTIETAKQVGLDAQRSVVRVVPPGGLGTGFHIGDGYVVTNSHVVESADVGSTSTTLRTFGKTFSDTETVDATLLGRTPGAEVPDLALLETDFSDVTPSVPGLSYRRTTDLSERQPLVVVGHPRGAGDWIISLGRFVSYASDTVYDYEPAESDAEQFVSDTPIRSGNSGSPTLTLDGEVVGCLYGGTTNDDVLAHAPEKVHTNFLDHPDYDTHSNSAVFEEYFSKWK